MSGYVGLPRRLGVAWWRRLLAALLATGLGAASVLGTVLLVLLLATVLGVGLRVTGPDDTRLFADPLWDLGAALAVVAAILPALLLAVRLAEGRRPGTVSSVAGRLRWGVLGRCLGPAAVAIVLILVLLTVFPAGESTPDVALQSPGRVLAGLAVVVLLVPFQASAEEYARGFVMQALGRVWPGILVSGVLFTLAHLPSTVWGVLQLMWFSVVAGVLVARVGGLEPAIALHVVNNLLFFALAVPFLDESAALGTAGDAGWQVLAANLVALPVYALAVLRLVRPRSGTRSRAPDAAGFSDPAG
ncbi:MAG: lysostaphin resistance A-like protein [Kineosporiaceae bacterium]